MRMGLAWCGLAENMLLKSRESVLQRNVGVVHFCLGFGGVFCLFVLGLFVFNSLSFWLQRYFFLDRGILKYSKCQADVSDQKTFKAIIR